ncbi:MAG: hypothetical protein EXR12_14455 [Rhodospirillaceae bacterium]|nr:hypothetical protein [Rhodospirillaceae bacterium]
MSLRVGVAVAAVLLVAACTSKSSDKAPPSAQAPGQRTPVVALPPPSGALPPPASASRAPSGALPPPASTPATAVAAAAPAGPASANNVPANRWRAVLIAGDNNSPAFDNGVESFREKLAARGVQSIRVFSSNPARAAPGQLATSGNVRGAIRGLGGDACLAFITSHGEPKGFFLRSDRKFFEPSTMESALAAGCGNAPTVVIISACHSGTFMTSELRKPNRIIMTAAARDRTSFGCGATDLYTYYDQCLLQSFDQVATWRDLTAATRTCVDNLERTRSIKAASDPQNFVGSSVFDLRIPGR